jgi:hypothetical protein
LSDEDLEDKHGGDYTAALLSAWLEVHAGCFLQAGFSSRGKTLAPGALLDALDQPSEQQGCTAFVCHTGRHFCGGAVLQRRVASS